MQILRRDRIQKMLDAAGVRYYKYNRTDREITIKV